MLNLGMGSISQERKCSRDATDNGDQRLMVLGGHVNDNKQEVIDDT